MVFDVVENLVGGLHSHEDFHDSPPVFTYEAFQEEVVRVDLIVSLIVLIKEFDEAIHRNLDLLLEEHLCYEGLGR